MTRKRAPYFVVKFRGDAAISAHDSTLLISRKCWRRKNGKFVMTGVVVNGGWNLTYRDGLLITGRGDPGRKVKMIEIARVPDHVSVYDFFDALEWFDNLPSWKKAVIPAVTVPGKLPKANVCPTCGH